MRILFVTPYMPSLIRVRPFNFIKQLSRRHEVTLVALTYGDPSESDDIELMKEYCEKVYTLPLSKSRSLMNCCKQLVSSMPLQAAYTHFPEGGNFISQIIENSDFDVLHVEHIRGANLALNANRIPRIYDSVDCITRLLKQRLAQRTGAFERALNYEELIKMRSYEPRIASMFDKIIITSEYDKRALEKLIRRFTARTSEKSSFSSGRIPKNLRLTENLYSNNGNGNGSSHIKVVRNGVDSDYFRPMNTNMNPFEIAFSGKMSYLPNVLAVISFYNEVFTKIRREIPAARFKVIGSNPPGIVRKLENDHAVEVTGHVQDIRPHLASARVLVCPMTVGVGIQNKVLEAMAMGKPVVATSTACKGIPEIVNGIHLIRVDEWESMAEAIIGIMNEPEYGLDLGRQACRLIRNKYSWDAATGILEETYRQSIDTRRSRILNAA